MKVLHVNTHINIGGIGHYIVSLSRAMKVKGVDCLVASSGGDFEKELSNLSIKHFRVDLRTKFEFAPKVFRAASSLVDIIKEENIDLMHAHTRASQVAAHLAAQRTGVPYVTTCHGYFKPRLSRMLFDTWGSKVVAISNAVKDHLEKDFKIKPDRIEVIYTGIDAERFFREYSSVDIANVRKSLGLGHGPVVGTMGRLSSVKGHSYLIDAIGRIVSRGNDLNCIIIGSGPEEGVLKKKAMALGIENRIRFIGSVYVDLPLYLSMMDIFIFPSIREGLGLALLEAMAAGRPCIASDVGGIGDIIKDGFSGILVRAKDPAAIAAQVTRLMEDNDLRRRMAANGRTTVKERFLIDSTAGKMANLYERVIS